jgi:ABC-type lipoprotein export system ATPase subunit
MNGALLEIRSLTKKYEQPGGSITALCLDFMEAGKGEAVAITGPSGSGKTTLLHLLAALSRPSGGYIRFDGRDLASLGASSARWRAAHVGYVFQNMNLLPDFDVLENLLLAAEVSNVPKSLALERAYALVARLGLENRLRRRPDNLSLGEQQRVAAARALIHKPPLVLADEPTASLDAQNAEIIVDMLLELREESLLVVATHDEAVKKRFSRVVELRKSEGQPCA